MSDLQDRSEAPADMAAEYALGVLTGAERREAERRMREDGGFASSVLWWENRLAPLFGAIRPAEAPADVWERVSEDIDRIARVSATYRGTLANRAERPAPARGLAGVSPIWRTIAGASSLLAVASLAALAIMIPPGGQGLGTAPQATLADGALTASLASDTGLVYFTVVVDLDSRTATLVPVDGIAEAGRVPELWLIENDAPAPRSLGVITGDRPLRVRLDTGGEAASAGATLAISLEPEGGSPTGSPTGPVVASGSLDRI
ncbi:anti-sigma factor [Fulvimarina endophytica]|nr:anti-sigma factor [Fulvimarina endophytica]